MVDDGVVLRREFEAVRNALRYHREMTRQETMVQNVLLGAITALLGVLVGMHGLALYVVYLGVSGGG